MKVALVAEWLDSWRGGAETSTLQFLHHLMQTEIELHVFTRSRPASTPGMHVHTVGGAAMSRTRRSMTFAHRVETMVQAEQIDLVHAISPCRVADIYQPRGGTVAESIDRNLALRRHGASQVLKRYANRFNVRQRYLLRLERAMLGPRQRTGRRSMSGRLTHAPIIVAISRYVVQQLRRHYSVPDDRIRLIYNGVDPDTASAAQRRQDRRVIRDEFGIRSSDCLVLQVAHNFRLKGVQRWMEALALMVKGGTGDLRSLVIGKGDSPAWRRLAVRLGIDRVLTFVGASDNVAAFYHAADVLVHPTYYDPCSRVVLEAMAAGLPCITSRWDGAAEMIEHGSNGIVLSDPWDVRSLAEQMEQLRDVSRRRAMGERAKLVGAKTAMARHAEEMVRLYRDLLPTGAGR